MTDISTTRQRCRAERLTLVEGLGVLKRVDELGIKPRSHFNSHAAEKKKDVHETEVSFLVPRRLVLFHESGDHRVSGGSHVDHFRNDELFGVEIERRFDWYHSSRRGSPDTQRLCM